MFLRCLFIILSFILIVFIVDIVFPRLKLKYRLYKDLKKKKQKQEAFKKKMNELEIK